MHWSKGRTWIPFGCVVLLGALVLILPPAISQEFPQCPAAPNLEGGSVTFDTNLGLDAVGKLLGKIGIGVNVRDTRDNVLKDNPRADQS